jgi:hypothetical protein
MAACLLHHLVDDELGVPPDVETLDAELDGDVRPLRRASYSAMLLDAGKYKHTT